MMLTDKRDLEAIEREDGGGWVTSDGEPYDAPEGDNDWAAWAAHKVWDATQEMRKWERERIKWVALLLKAQEEPSARYGDLAAVIKVRDLGRKAPFDSRALAEGIDARFTLGEHYHGSDYALLWALLNCVTGLDPKRAGRHMTDVHTFAFNDGLVAEEFIEWLESLATPVSTGEKSRPWVEVQQVRRRFPGT